MFFHLIGTACIVATMGGGIVRDEAGRPVRPVCQELKSPKDYHTYAQCVDVVNSPAFHQGETLSLPGDGYKWYTLHCIQE